MSREAIIRRTIGLEGGLTDHPDDSGGLTNLGVTEATARAYGYMGAMEDLTVAQVIRLYTHEFWTPIRGDALMRESPEVAEEVFDTAVNAGPHTAITFLQRALNGLNVKGTLYRDIVVDGLIGAKTVGAVTQYCEHRDPKVLVKLLNCLQGEYYVRLVEKREKDESFLYGWIRNRVRL